MATTTYEYTKTTSPDLSDLKQDIENSAMTQAGKDDYELAYWKGADDKLYIQFANVLVAGDETILDGIAAALPDSAAPKGALRGRFYKYNKAYGSSTTTGNTYVTKISLNTKWLEAGKYLIRWAYVWWFANNNNNFEARLRIDDVGKWQHKQEPKDPGTGQRHNVMGFRVDTLTEGEHTIELQFRSGDGTSEAGIKEAIVEIYEVPDE